MSIYVIAPLATFAPKFQDFNNKTGFYFDVGFKNMGSVRYSNDGLVILEEDEDKFDPDDLLLEGVEIFTHVEALVEMKKSNWKSEEI